MTTTNGQSNGQYKPLHEDPDRLRRVEDLVENFWTCPSRPRVDKHPTQRKICWEAVT